MGKWLDWLLGRPAKGRGQAKPAGGRGRSGARAAGRGAAPGGGAALAELDRRARQQIGEPPRAVKGALPHRHRGEKGEALDQAVVRDILKQWLKEK